MEATTTAAAVAYVDLQGVPSQPAVVATRCVVRADLDHSPAVAGLRGEPDPSELLRRDEARAHAASVREVLAASVPPAELFTVVAGSEAEAVEQTLAAMGGDARVILGARLPTDHGARRLGTTTVLVRDDRIADVGWLPVEIKRHAYVRPARGSSLGTSPVSAPYPGRATAKTDTTTRSARRDQNGLQLAHQWRLLEAMGGVAHGQRATGGVIDRNGELWWLDLEDERSHTRWSPTPVSMLAHYDHAFGFRLEVIANRLAREAGEDVERRVEPVRIGQCATCPWEAVCRTEMESVDHVSLIPRSTFDHFKAHRERGVTTRAQVARLHWPTAYLMHGAQPRSPSVDLVALEQLAAGRSADTPIADLLRPRRGSQGEPHFAPVQLHLLGMEPEVPAATPVEPTQSAESPSPGPEGPAEEWNPLVALERVEEVLHRFQEVGVNTVADLAVVDPLTASYSGASCGHLPTVIDQARAALTDRPHLARGVDVPHVPRADIEVDVDMENVEEGVYLWGALVSGEAPHLLEVGVRPGYQPFFSFEPMGPEEQAEVFARFWSWLTELRTSCERTGRTLAVYCYTSAEHQKMTQIVAAAPPTAAVPSRAEVDQLVASEHWVDLYDVVRSNVVVGHGLGLKRVAPLAGFSWRDDDAGGLQSMAWHREALDNPDPRIRSENRLRLFAYNEDDVRATRAVREWLSTAAIGSIADWAPPEGP